MLWDILFMENINMFINNIVQFCKKHIEPIVIIFLSIIFYFLFFHNIGTYALMDVDETRYVSMARDMFNTKDFLTLYLNGEYFFEKPPLYFWQECLSFAIFGKINEFTARFPVALLGFIFSFVVYFTSKKRISIKFGIISSLITATTLEFVILAKYAILDIVLAFYVGLSIIVYFQTFFCGKRHKKFYWWAFYLFTGFAVMAKGIPGIAIPLGTVFFTSIITKRFKEIFKPIYFIPGVLLFLLIVLPWHVIMLNKYNPLFYDEYIIKHHLHRFLNTAHNEIGRKQPFYYYLLTILWGFIPWIFSMIAVLVEKLKNFKNITILKSVKKFDFYEFDNIHKSLILCWISVIWIFMFFSSSSTKLVTYILPIYYPLSIIAAHVWEDYINKKYYEKSINISVYIFGGICAIAGLLAIFTPLYLPQQLNTDISSVKWFCIVLLIIFGIGTIYCAKNKKTLSVFIFYVLFITLVSGFATEKFFEIDYKFGQQELMEFAKYAKENNYTIATFGMDRKYSLIFYNDEIADYNTNKKIDINSINEDLKKTKNIVILKNKQMKIIENKLNYEVLKVGRKYTLIKGNNR